MTDTITIEKQVWNSTLHRSMVLQAENEELKETNAALKVELKEVCDVLIRKCPEMTDWVMSNWKNLYEVEK
jgi:hypothetical protein